MIIQTRVFLHLQLISAITSGKVTVTVSHLQSLTPYAMMGSTMYPQVQLTLSITPTSFLLSILTHSTSGENRHTVMGFANTNTTSVSSLYRRWILTEDAGDDDDPSDAQTCEEPQHCKHDHRRGEDAGRGETQPQDVGDK